MTMCSLIDLPSEILTVLASYIDSHTLRLSLALTCKSLHAVATDPRLWSLCVVTPCCLREMILLCDKYTTITALDAGSVSMDDGPGLAALLRLRNLQYLNTRGMGSLSWDEQLYQPLRFLQGSELTASALAAGANLVSLSTSGHEPIGTDLATVCPNLTRLGCLTFMAGGSDFPGLVELQLESWGPKDELWNEFAKVHTRLRSLDVKKLTVGYRWPNLPPEGLVYPTSLTHVGLGDQAVLNNGFLSELIACNPGITSLDLPVFSYGVANDLNEVITGKLRKLKYQHAWITDFEAFSKIAEIEELICPPHSGINQYVVLPTVLKCGAGLEASIKAVGAAGLWRLRELHIAVQLSAQSLAALGEGASHLKSLVCTAEQLDYDLLAPACTCVRVFEFDDGANGNGGQPHGDLGALAAAVAQNVESVTVRNTRGSEMLVALLPHVAPRALDSLSGRWLEVDAVSALATYADGGGRITRFEVSVGSYLGVDAEIRSTQLPTDEPELVARLVRCGSCRVVSEQ